MSRPTEYKFNFFNEKNRLARVTSTPKDFYTALLDGVHSTGVVREVVIYDKNGDLLVFGDADEAIKSVLMKYQADDIHLFKCPCLSLHRFYTSRSPRYEDILDDAERRILLDVLGVSVP